MYRERKREMRAFGARGRADRTPGSANLGSPRFLWAPHPEMATWAGRSRTCPSPVEPLRSSLNKLRI